MPPGRRVVSGEILGCLAAAAAVDDTTVDLLLMLTTDAAVGPMKGVADSNADAALIRRMLEGSI